MPKNSEEKPCVPAPKAKQQKALNDALAEEKKRKDPKEIIAEQDESERQFNKR